MREELESQLSMSTSGDMVERVTYMVFGAIMTTTRAFHRCQIKIDPMGMRIFAKISLLWWAKIKWLDITRERWLREAESNAEEFVPDGFQLLVYYERYR